MPFYAILLQLLCACICIYVVFMLQVKKRWDEGVKFHLSYTKNKSNHCVLVVTGVLANLFLFYIQQYLGGYAANIWKIIIYNIFLIFSYVKTVFLKKDIHTYRNKLYPRHIFQNRISTKRFESITNLLRNLIYILASSPGCWKVWDSMCFGLALAKDNQERSVERFLRSFYNWHDFSSIKFIAWSIYSL